MADKIRVSMKHTDDYCTIEESPHGSGADGHTAPVPHVRGERRVNLVMMLKIFGVLLVAGLISLSVYYFIKLNHMEQELEELRNVNYILTSNYTELQESQDTLQSQYATLNEKLDELTKVFSDLNEFYCDATNTSPDNTYSVCKPGWVFFSSKCYFISTNIQTWKESQDWCETRGGRLVNIESSDVLDFLKRKAAVTQRYFWIGRYNISKENKSTRMDAGPVKSKRASDDNKEECLLINLQKNLVFNYSCEDHYHWICESAAFPLHI
ncbi:CD209 antigen-like protein E isoform X6 [Erpetoichthys calabaricus]|uniref:CD209 antigen-like protein E isoform X4 n=1 Tax=Erpetoichthys calabaricus TaxID=27687 RepID=UPI00223447FB|nr:CD209 antigen-like protein E isoform X4 [Erpetoichthys calabaricus]XP_051781924.1 CD209 antigen-like protein E isoform X5 [Erpetoichthys calabaricus]XP_051781925.1 CD209 antigen-like protein E isoform X6 [Erpetoichthys calabaricus]